MPGPQAYRSLPIATDPDGVVFSTFPSPITISLLWSYIDEDVLAPDTANGFLSAGSTAYHTMIYANDVPTATLDYADQVELDLYDYGARITGAPSGRISIWCLGAKVGEKLFNMEVAIAAHTYAVPTSTLSQAQLADLRIKVDYETDSGGDPPIPTTSL